MGPMWRGVLEERFHCGGRIVESAEISMYACPLAKGRAKADDRWKGGWGLAFRSNRSAAEGFRYAPPGAGTGLRTNVCIHGSELGLLSMSAGSRLGFFVLKGPLGTMGFWVAR